MTSTQKHLRILMVEDVENDAVILSHELNRGGFDFHAKRVDSQSDFLRELTSNPPDLILSDHGLPSFGGFEALELAQERCPETPFIFVTASHDEAQARVALRCGARAWVHKSNLPNLVPAVQDALRLTEERQQRRHAEQKIREHAERFRLIASELKGCAMFMLGLDGRILEWNPGAAALFGFTAEEIIGRDFACLFRAEDRAVGKPKLDLRAASSGRHEEEGWRVRKDGAQFWTHAALAVQRDDQGAAVRFAYVVRDLTEHRQTEETLHERAESYRLLFDQCPEALFVLSEGKIVVANHAAHRLLGAESSAALVGRAVSDLVHEKGRGELRDWLLRLPPTNQTAAPISIHAALHCADDCTRPARLTAVQIPMQNETVVLLLAHDLTGEELAHDLQTQALVADALQACQARHAAILATAPDAIICTNADTVITEWNDTAVEIFGHSRAAAMGRAVGKLLGAASLTAPDLAELARHFQADAPTRAQRADQIVVRRANGAAFLADLVVREGPATLPRFYTLVFREPAANPLFRSESPSCEPAREPRPPLVPLCDPAKVFIDEPRPEWRPESSRPPICAQNGTAPVRPPRGRIGSLRQVQDATEAAAEARRSIGVIISHTRTPWGDVGILSRAQVEELERVIRLLEIRLDERELALSAAEAKLVDQNRNLAEAEALLAAREELLTATRGKAAAETPSSSIFSTDEIEALRKLKVELERQAESLTVARAELKTREEFIERSEAALMEKMQTQQEREIELEQLEENLRTVGHQSARAEAALEAR